MTKALDFYFDFVSPYGYFAAMHIDALAAKYDRVVEWHPVLLGVVFKTTGAMPLPMVPMKGPYVLRDLERTARFHNIPFTFPSAFPLMTQAAARAVLFIRDQYGATSAANFARAIYQAYFVDGTNIGEQENVLRIASEMGLDASAISDAINSPSLKEQLKSNIETAMERGVFGSPFIFVDDEPFWGFDRFDQIDALLQQSQK